MAPMVSVVARRIHKTANALSSSSLFLRDQMMRTIESRVTCCWCVFFAMRSSHLAVELKGFRVSGFTIASRKSSSLLRNGRISTVWDNHVTSRLPKCPRRLERRRLYSCEKRTFHARTIVPVCNYVPVRNSASNFSQPFVSLTGHHLPLPIHIFLLFSLISAFSLSNVFCILNLLAA